MFLKSLALGKISCFEIAGD